ncbi:SusC/RagA family TonB-linked outer membrane protein [Sunxiuqinia sp. sy24]|uniref:SusC/RagA family TonB-linked outer membrane protein n=1 Tax=Sunxiuqinia sp. sy24 TaxID=3461495 RepID=UPI004045440C
MKKVHTVRYWLTYVEKIIPLRFLTTMLLLVCLSSFAGYAQADGLKVSGKVTDSGKEPLPGVSVSVKGTYEGTVTDPDGAYSINGLSEEDVLVFSFIGTKTVEITVGSQKVINVKLESDYVNLEEVVAIGYGSTKKENLTGAITTVSAEVMENRPVTSVTQALQGVVPGLVVSRSAAGGKPGVDLLMNIRGAGSPYILIDGVEGSISNLNPADVETMTVLKDAASAAIYGAKAAYGVVLITTKGGKKGVRVNYSNNYSFSAPIKLPEQANSYAYAQYFNAASVNGGGLPLVSVETLERIKRYINEGDIPGTIPNPMDPTKWANTEYANANTDWFDFHFKDWALQETHNISVSGASDKTEYYISGSNLNQEGIITFGDDTFEKQTISSKIKTELYDWLSASSNMRYTSRLVDMPTFLNQNINMLHRISQSRWPSNPIKDPNGHYMRVSDVAEIEQGGRTIDKNTGYMMTIGLEIEPIKGWVTEVAYDWNNTTWEQQYSVNPTFTYYGVGEKEFQYGNIEDSRYYTHTGVTDYKSPKIYSTYTKSINDHNFKIMGGFQQSKMIYSNHNVGRKILQTPLLPAISTATGEIFGGESKGHYATRSYFGRFNYNYKEKYLLEVNWRADGSSYFQKGKRWGSFPSFSAGYNLAKEDFMEDHLYYVSQLKFRGSYGSLGNQTASPYAYLESYRINSNYPWLMEGGNKPNVVYMPAVPSPDLTWETVSMLTFGFDGAFLNNRLTATFDWYKRDRKDLLGPADTPPATYGGNVPLLNNVDIETKGFEVSLGWQNNIGDFSYFVKGTLTNYKSVYKKYNNPTGYLWTNYVGKEVGTIWGYTSNKLFQTEEEVNNAPDLSQISNDRWFPGDVKYEDINNDGEVSPGASTLDDHGDLSIIGNWVPKFQYGLSAGFNWRNFDFSMFWQGVGEKDAWLNGNFFFGSANSRWQTTAFKQHLDYWTKDNPDAYYPRPYLTQAGVDKNQRVSTRYLQDASYLRLKNAQIGYSLPDEMLEKFWLKKINVYVSGENLLTFTKLSDIFDPEALGAINSGTAGKTYPIQRTFSVGVNLTF